ncbi:Fc.00g058040.m01.CDS01 [Cosmosporella sp. VM-42]
MFNDVFQYTVLPFRIPTQDPERSLNAFIAHVVQLYGDENNLIIVYYSGHGGPRSATKSPCTWAAQVAGGPTLDWSLIQPQLFLASCDVVIILDCCFAGQAARASTTNNVEFLAATDKDQYTPAGTGSWPSFTRVLIREMKVMALSNELITLPTLHKRMVEESSGLQRQPFYVALAGNASAGVVKLVKLGQTALVKNSHNSTTSLNSVCLQLSLIKDLDMKTVSALLQWLTKGSPSSIEDIQLVDRVFSEASDANDLGKDLLEGSSRSRGQLLPFLSEEGKKEAQLLFADLQSALFHPEKVQLAAPDLKSLVRRVESTSMKLVTFVTDSLTAMDRESLSRLEARKSRGLQDLRTRVAMRLLLINDEASETRIRIDFIDQTNEKQRIRCGKRGDDYILVEYVYYEANDQNAFSRLSRQVKRASALHAEPKSDAFRCLHGAGFLHDTLYGPRFGFAYLLPPELVGRRPGLLSDLIKQVKTVPLEVRVKLSCAVCDAVLHLHSIGWYHKNIRSDNILVFSSAVEGEDIIREWDFANPYLIGFDCSRPSDAETRDTIDFTTANNIYRHPERWGRTARFEKRHELYSLGILLLEIGCWKALPVMDSRKREFSHIQDPEALRTLLLRSTLDKLGHAAGTNYRETVRVCLSKDAWMANEDWKSQKMVREKVLDPLLSFIG